jgi:hypothetical protein
MSTNTRIVLLRNRLLWSTKLTLEELPTALSQRTLALMSHFTHYYIATHSRYEAMNRESSYTKEGFIQAFNFLIAQWSRDVEPIRLIAATKRFGR